MGPAEVEAALQEEYPGGDAESEARQPCDAVEVPAGQAEDAAQRAAEEDQRSDHHEGAEDEPHQRL